jgi:hypothetical protein
VSLPPLQLPEKVTPAVSRKRHEKIKKRSRISFSWEICHGPTVLLCGRNRAHIH